MNGKGIILSITLIILAILEIQSQGMVFESQISQLFNITNKEWQS